MISIFRNTNGTESTVAVVSDANATLERGIMGADEVSLSVTVSEPLDARVGDYTRVDGEVYTINREPDVVKASAVEYKYDLVLESPQYNLLDKLYMAATTGKSRFTLNGTLEDFVDLLLVNMNEEGFDAGWTKAEDREGRPIVVETERKTLTFDNASCRDVLNRLAGEFAVEYEVRGRTIAFMERLERARDVVFEQGMGKGLYTLERRNVDKDNTVTRAYVYGSTENLPAGYRDGQVDRLCPRERGTEEYIGCFENRTEYPKLVEREVYFDDVKPSFTGSVASVSADYLKVRCPEIDFDLNTAKGDGSARVNFLTGDLMGKAFGFTYVHETRTLELIPQEDELAQADGQGKRPMLPNAVWHPRVGDKLTFTGIELPEAYVRAAEALLVEKGRKWMQVHSSLRVRYNLDVDYRHARETGVTLSPGDVVGIAVPDREEVQRLRVTSVKKQLNTGKLTCEVSNYLTESAEDTMNAKIQEVRNSIELDRNELLYTLNATREWTTRNFGRLAEIMEDGQAIVWDADGWEIKTAKQVPDAVNWDTHPFGDYLDQPVRRGDNVRHNSVTARAFTEEDEGHDPRVVSLRLVEEGGGEATTLGGLTNVDVRADEAGDNEVLVCKDGVWTPRGEVFIPTGTTPDGTDIKTFQNLLDYIAMHGGGGTPGEVQRNLRVVNDLDSKNISASKGEACNLKFTFVSQERYSISEPYENTGERGLCQISVKNTNNSEFVVVRQMYVASGTPLTVDVAEFLTSGSNQVMIKVTGEVTEEVTPAFVYTVYLTSLSVSADNFRWWTAFLNDIVIPLNIGGNISKTLHVTLRGEGYNVAYDVPLGTNVYTETAYNYRVAHPGKSGVYELSAYVDNSDGTIRTQTVSYNVICAVAGERVKLLAINRLLEKATNWTENTLFEYAMYDGDGITTSARFVVSKDGTAVFASDEDAISTSTRHTFSFPMEVETMDNADFEIVARVLDGEREMTAPMAFAVNNSLGYSAVAGAVFYMNPKTRTNRQGNYREVINETDASAVAASWKNMNWGNDGWIADGDDNKVLRLMAGGEVSMAYYPFKKECARTGKTVEIDYRIDNVTNYEEPIIRISAPSGDSFVGLEVYADNVLMHSHSLKDDGVQNLHTFEGKRTRLTLTILPDAYGNPEFNLCILYVNGRKNREFTYQNNDYFAHEGGIVIGSAYADVDVYGLRVYDLALTSQGVARNYVNWLVNTDEKQRETEWNDILDANGSEIEFENTRDQYNCIVYDNTIPSMADQTQRVGTLEVFFTEHPEWNVSIDHVTAKGQGTSSMKYWIWNTRYQLDKKQSVITYANGTTSPAGAKWAMTPSLPAGRKFTAKKNYASSMHSHKIGAVNSYTDLIREVGILNEAMVADEKVRVSVWQAPFVCFEKLINDEGETVYVFRGLYTFGPDKGDADTFGYDTDRYPGLMSIEGSDNSPLLTLFRVPWNAGSNLIVYNEDEEAWQYNGANSFDYGEGKIENISKFIPAYNIVYQCSPRLRPFEGSLADLNGRVADYKNQACEFWIAKSGDADRYNVCYFESSRGAFVLSDIGEGPINLVRQLADKGYGLTTAELTGKTNEELNELFIRARVAKFRAEAGQYWDIDDCLFFMNNVEFNAGTDERAKNTYPYSFGTESSRWRWRVDDADTRFDTTNRGLPDKGYSVETHDTDDTGASIWNGETNNFFNLMEMAFAEEKVISMRKSMAAMQTLGGRKSGNDLEKLFAFYQKYFFDQAQEYFPSNAYNADAKYCYENGKLAYDDGRYSNDTDPITQSLGDHYLAEQRWITKRILYMMSKYSYGLFSANGTDTITVRAAGNSIRYELTPGMDMYPAIANGTSIIRGERTRAGEVCTMEIELSGTGDQQNAIMGASYLLDIGDWYDKNVSGSMVIQGKMLRDIRLGRKTGEVLISISSLTISNCVSLQRLVLSNIKTLAGTLNLMACTHLQEVHADGTAISQMRLPEGGGLRVVEFSAYNQYLHLSNYPLLTNEGVGIELCKQVITDFFVVDCPRVTPMELLVRIMDAQEEQGNGHALKRIRAVGFNETYADSSILDKLSKLADGSYEGLSSDGLAGEDPVPVLDGTLNINGNAYEDSIEALRGTFNRLVLNVTGNFYIKIKDPEVRRLVIADYSRDEIGLTRSDADSVTLFKWSTFYRNTEIEDFSDFGDIFRNVTTIEGVAFEGCTNLKSFSLPKDQMVVVKKKAFFQTSLDEKSIDFTRVKEMEHWAFKACKFTHVYLPANVDISGAKNSFEENQNLLDIEFEEGITIIPANICSMCHSLITFIMPSTITTIESDILHGCRAIENIVCKAITPPELTSAFGYIVSTKYSVYVPDASLELYKTTWVNIATNRIKPMSEYKK